MADLKKTIAIIFSGVDELSGPINTITGKLDGFSGHVEAIADPLAGAADNILKMDTALAAMAAGGLLLAFNKSMEFESAVIELKKVLGDGAGVDVAIEEAIRLSEIYGQSANDILLSTADFKQAGYDIADSMTLTKDALDLVIAGNIDAAQSSDLIIAALKGFRVEADEARRYVDILNEVSNNYATDVEQLAIGMSKLSPIAQQMGFSMEETAGLLVPVIEIFRSGDEAAVALKTGLLKLVDDAKPVRDALASIGVSQHDANGELRAGHDIYVDVATAFQGLDDKQKLFITSQLVGIEQSARMVNVFDNLKLATDIAATAMDSAGSASREVAERLKSAEVAVDRFKVGFENLATAIGDQFRAATVEAINGGAEIETALRQIVDSGTFAPIFDELNRFSVDLGNLLSTIARNMPEAFEQVDFSGLLNALGDVGDSIGNLFDGVDLSTPEGLAEVVQKVVNTLESLAHITAGMVDQFKPFAQSVWGVVESFNSMDDASKKSAGEILAMAKAVSEAGLEIAAAILVIGDYADKLGPIFSVVIKTISGGFDTAVVVWNTLKLIFIKTLEDLLAASKIFADVALFGAFSDDVAANQAILADWRKSVESDLAGAADSAMKNLTGIETNFSDTGKAAGDAKGDVDNYLANLDTIPAHKQTDVATEADQESIDQTKEAVSDAAPDKITTEAGAKPDKASLESAKAEIEKNLPFQKTTLGKGKADTASLSKTKSTIDKAIPESKMMEIQLQGDIDMELARIKASAETVQTALEWSAKINIAGIEADAKVAVAAFDSIATAIDATSSAAASMFDSLASNINDMDLLDKLRLFDILNEQMAMQREALALQRELTQAQVEYMKAKADALRDGEGLISISSDGLEPALELIMWEIIKKVQIRANEESAEFLLGLDDIDA